MNPKSAQLSQVHNSFSAMTWAVLLPFTSRHCDSKEAALQLLTTFWKTNLANGASKVSLYIGLDSNDRYFNESSGESVICNLFQTLGCAQVKVKFFSPSKPASICKIWKHLAEQAYKDGSDYFVLLGDDVTISYAGPCHDWMTEIEKEFEKFSGKFACIALRDLACFSFPTFPVLNRIHFDAFGGEIFPDDFVNQDADPFLFEVYNHFGRAFIHPNVTIHNEFGGVELEGTPYFPPRYEREHVKDWKTRLLPSYVDKVCKWLAASPKAFHADFKSIPGRKSRIDVCIPSYRVEERMIRGILGVKTPANSVVNFIVAVDNPELSTSDLSWLLRDLVLQNLEQPQQIILHVRRHSANLGASEARNTCLSQSASLDYVWFCDDDVIPHRNILEEYLICAQNDTQRVDCAMGYVGLTQLPQATSAFHIGFRASGCEYFWNIATKQPTTPWGITANLFIRSPLHLGEAFPRFDPRFIKTGGGEDIHFCLQVSKLMSDDALNPMKTCSTAVVDHPWWNQGRRCYGHFYGWAYGDSLLQFLHPQYTFSTLPNLVETLVAQYIFWSLYCLIPAMRCADSTSYEIYQFDELSTLVSFTSMIILSSYLVLADLAIAIVSLASDSYRRSFFQNNYTLPLAFFEMYFIRCCNDVGHFLGPLFRGHLLSVLLIGRRFDWFCGSLPSYPRAQQSEHTLRFVLFICIIAMHTGAWRLN